MLVFVVVSLIDESNIYHQFDLICHIDDKDRLRLRKDRFSLVKVTAIPNKTPSTKKINPLRVIKSKTTRDTKSNRATKSNTSLTYHQ